MIAVNSSGVSMLSRVTLEPFSFTVRLIHFTSRGRVVPFAQLPFLVYCISLCRVSFLSCLVHLFAVYRLWRRLLLPCLFCSLF